MKRNPRYPHISTPGLPDAIVTLRAALDGDGGAITDVARAWGERLPDGQQAAGMQWYAMGLEMWRGARGVLTIHSYTRTLCSFWDWLGRHRADESGGARVFVAPHEVWEKDVEAYCKALLGEERPQRWQCAAMLGKRAVVGHFPELLRVVSDVAWDTWARTPGKEIGRDELVEMCRKQITEEGDAVFLADFETFLKEEVDASADARHCTMFDWACSRLAVTGYVKRRPSYAAFCRMIDDEAERARKANGGGGSKLRKVAGEYPPYPYKTATFLKPEGKGAKESTVAQRLACMSSFWTGLLKPRGQMKQPDWFWKNPWPEHVARFDKQTKQEQPERTVARRTTMTEMNALLDRLKALGQSKAQASVRAVLARRDLLAVLCMSLMGLRVSEMCNLRRIHFTTSTDMTTGEIRRVVKVRGKGKKLRTIPLPQSIEAAHRSMHEAMRDLLRKYTADATNPELKTTPEMDARRKYYCDIIKIHLDTSLDRMPYVPAFSRWGNAKVKAGMKWARFQKQEHSPFEAEIMNQATLDHITYPAVFLPWEEDGVRKMLQEHADRIGQDDAERADLRRRLHPHGLRHLYAALVQRGGGGMGDGGSALSESMGHASGRATDTYRDKEYAEGVQTTSAELGLATLRGLHLPKTPAPPVASLGLPLPPEPPPSPPAPPAVEGEPPLPLPPTPPAVPPPPVSYPERTPVPPRPPQTPSDVLVGPPRKIRKKTPPSPPPWKRGEVQPGAQGPAGPHREIRIKHGGTPEVVPGAGEQSAPGYEGDTEWEEAASAAQSKAVQPLPPSDPAPLATGEDEVEDVSPPKQPATITAIGSLYHGPAAGPYFPPSPPYAQHIFPMSTKSLAAWEREGVAIPLVAVAMADLPRPWINAKVWTGYRSLLPFVLFTAMGTIEAQRIAKMAAMLGPQPKPKPMKPNARGVVAGERVAMPLLDLHSDLSALEGGVRDLFGVWVNTKPTASRALCLWVGALFTHSLLFQHKSMRHKPVWIEYADDVNATTTGVRDPAPGDFRSFVAWRSEVREKVMRRPSVDHLLKWFKENGETWHGPLEGQWNLSDWQKRAKATGEAMAEGFESVMDYLAIVSGKSPATNNIGLQKFDVTKATWLMDLDPIASLPTQELADMVKWVRGVYSAHKRVSDDILRRAVSFTPSDDSPLSFLALLAPFLSGKAPSPMANTPLLVAAVDEYTRRHGVDPVLGVRRTLRAMWELRKSLKGGSAGMDLSHEASFEKVWAVVYAWVLPSLPEVEAKIARLWEGKKGEDDSDQREEAIKAEFVRAQEIAQVMSLAVPMKDIIESLMKQMAEQVARRSPNDLVDIERTATFLAETVIGPMVSEFAGASANRRKEIQKNLINAVLSLRFAAADVAGVGTKALDPFMRRGAGDPRYEDLEVTEEFNVFVPEKWVGDEAGTWASWDMRGGTDEQQQVRASGRASAMRRRGFPEDWARLSKQEVGAKMREFFSLAVCLRGMFLAVARNVLDKLGVLKKMGAEFDEGADIEKTEQLMGDLAEEVGVGTGAVIGGASSEFGGAQQIGTGQTPVKGMDTPVEKKGMSIEAAEREEAEAREAEDIADLEQEMAKTWKTSREGLRYLALLKGKGMPKEAIEREFNKKAMEEGKQLAKWGKMTPNKRTAAAAVVQPLIPPGLAVLRYIKFSPVAFWVWLTHDV